ncbi:26S proteasome non-ATPase regulatory subunit 14 [Glugoides intestinalis]
MLLNLNRKTWASNLMIKPRNTEKVSELISKYSKMINNDKFVKKEDLEMRKVGKVDYRKRLVEKTNQIIEDETIRCLLHNIHYSIFK